MRRGRHRTGSFDVTPMSLLRPRPLQRLAGGRYSASVILKGAEPEPSRVTSQIAWPVTEFEAKRVYTWPEQIAEPSSKQRTSPSTLHISFFQPQASASPPGRHFQRPFRGSPGTHGDARP